MDSGASPSKHSSKKSEPPIAESLLQEFKRNKLVLYYILLTTPFTFFVYYSVPQSFSFNLYSYLGLFIKVCYYSFTIWSVYYFFHLLFNKERKPIKRFVRKTFNLLLPISKPIFFAIFILTLNISFSSYTFLKSLIPFINPYYLDVNFYHIDKWLHFGLDPWEITHSIFTTATSTMVLNVLYNLWFFVMWGVLLYFIIIRSNDSLRTQFLLTFLSSWFLIGNIMATILSSAGPAFLHTLNNSDLYAELMTILEVQNSQLIDDGLIPLWALSTQDMLWDKYISSSTGIGAGISAMPSMHVTIAVLIAMTLFRLNKKLGYISWIYAGLIQIGSVHLAWHYAIDGYFGALLIVILWHSIGYFLKNSAA